MWWYFSCVVVGRRQGISLSWAHPASNRPSIQRGLPLKEVGSACQAQSWSFLLHRTNVCLWNRWGRLCRIDWRCFSFFHYSARCTAICNKRFRSCSWLLWFMIIISDLYTELNSMLSVFLIVSTNVSETGGTNPVWKSNVSVNFRSLFC